MSDQSTLLKKLKKLSKALTLLQRPSFTVDITTIEKFADLKKAVEEKASIQGRTVKIGYQTGDYCLTYFIFGQNPQNPEDSGEVDFDEIFIDSAIEQAVTETKKLIASNILNDLVQKKLEELGLN